MSNKIFINYRRAISLKDAQLIQQLLEKSFGKSKTFLDVSGLDGGDNWLHTLERQVDASAAMVCLICDGWANLKDENDNRRLDNQNDFVRFEISRALTRNIPVLPILLDQAKMPDISELPNNLQPLSFIQAMHFRSESSEEDAEKISKRLRQMISARVKQGITWWKVATISALSFFAGGGLGYFMVLGNISKSEEQLEKSKQKINTLQKDLYASKNIIRALRKQIPNLRKVKETNWKPGVIFQECNNCPSMIVIKSGVFMMGSNRYKTEMPVHRVKIKSFAAGQYEVSFSEWDACVKAGACQNQLEDFGWGRGSRPVVNVSWQDAQSYVQWLSRKTGKNYRLLTEAEWEYAARAGTTTDYTYGDTIKRSQAQFSDKEWGSAKQTIPVGSLKPNPWQLFDIHGNVWEWVEDCKHEDYKNAPDNGTAKKSLNNKCTEHILRGGSWNNMPKNIRSAKRGWHNATYKSYSLGFRVARDLD